jgi:hypothetical protein
MHDCLRVGHTEVHPAKAACPQCALDDEVRQPVCPLWSLRRPFPRSGGAFLAVLLILARGCPVGGYRAPMVEGHVGVAGGGRGGQIGLRHLLLVRPDVRGELGRHSL